MEAAIVQSPIGLFTPSKSTGRSLFSAANSPEFLGFISAYPSSIKHNSSISYGKPMHKRGISFGSKRYTSVSASSSSSDFSGSLAPIAPLRLESPTGQFLSQILLSHPHLVPAAVEQQLEQLQTEFDSEKQNEEPSVSGIELALYRRIAEVKANERKKALEEILYALVVQKFMDADISLIPSVVSPSNSNQIDTQPSQDKKLEKLHSTESHEMIQSHLSLILGNHITDPNTVAQLSKLKVGQVYAASVMYGYFVKRVDQRFQLEKTMKTLPNGNGVMSCGLRSYVMSFDGETLERYARIRSKEAVNIIEKHTEALFGQPENDETSRGKVGISYGGLRRMVLEAVTFGSFLWDVESFVDSSELFHKRGRLGNEV